MMRWLLWSVLALVLVAMLAAISLPASLAWRWAAPPNSTVTLADISGVWWRGKAGSASIHGQEIGLLSWHLEPLSLLLAQPKLEVSAVGPAVNVKALWQRSDDGGAEWPSVRANLDAAWLGPMLKLPMLTPAGALELSLDHVRISPKQLPESGTLALHWRDAAIKGWLPAEIGSISLLAKGSAGQWLGEIRSEPGSALSAQGGWSLHGDQFQMELRLSAREPALPIAQVLPMIGQSEPDGSRLLKIEGRLGAPGTGPSP